MFVLPEHNVAAGEKLVLLIQHVRDQEPLAPRRHAETPTHHQNAIIDSANQWYDVLQHISSRSVFSAAWWQCCAALVRWRHQQHSDRVRKKDHVFAQPDWFYFESRIINVIWAWDEITVEILTSLSAVCRNVKTATAGLECSRNWVGTRPNNYQTTTYRTAFALTTCQLCQSTLEFLGMWVRFWVNWKTLH